MSRFVITRTENVTLVGGAPLRADILEAAVARAPVVIAADGGADQAMALGHNPVAVIGDMDSLSNPESWQNSDLEMFKIAEQETTDFEKCLYSVDAPLILGCGFLGKRMDHALAAMGVLLRYPDRAVILLGSDDLVFRCPAQLELTLPEGMTVSFHPCARVTGIDSAGLQWPLTGIEFAPWGRGGTSNRALGGPVRVAFDGPEMLVILPLAALDAAIAALGIPAR